MYSYQTPLVIGAQPQKCVGNSLFEWVFTNNESISSLVRVHKSTYVKTDTISTTDTIGTSKSINYGMTYGNGYVFIPSNIPSSYNIYRYPSDQDDPFGSPHIFNIYFRHHIFLTYEPFGGIQLVYNGYLWCVPINNIDQSLLRLDVFNNLSITSYKYDVTFPDSGFPYSADSTVSVYNKLLSITSDGVNGATKMFGFGGYIYTLKYSGSDTTIIKVSANIPRSSSGVSNSGPDFLHNYYNFSSTEIIDIASDNVSYVWFANNSNQRIYRVSISDSENYTYLPANWFDSGLTIIGAMTYGVGYLWISGKNSNVSSVVIQRDVVNNVTLRTITLPTYSYITSMDIYNQFLWMTDIYNDTLLKMQVYIPCFKEDSKILCLNSQMKEEYIPIQNIRKGTLVKTLLNGFVPVDMIGKSVISNPGGESRIKNRLYKCSMDKYPELFEDLYITGCHSILVDSLSDEQQKNTIDDLEKIYITDKKYRLMAFLDDRAIPYNVTGSFTIWHLALQNDDYYMNYGIFANGLLVESTSKRYMKELSGMELID